MARRFPAIFSFGGVPNELALAERPGRVNSGALGAGPLLLFLPRSETGGGGDKEVGSDCANGRPPSTGKQDGEGRPLAVGLKSPTLVDVYRGATLQLQKDAPFSFPTPPPVPLTASP